MNFKSFIGLIAMSITACSAMATYDGTGTFTKVTTVEDVTDGYYVLVGNGVTDAMNNDSSDGKGLKGTNVTVTDNTTITNPDKSIVWKIETNGSGRTIYNEVIEKYVSYTGTANTAQVVTSVTDDAQRWTLSVSGGVFSVTNCKTTDRKLCRNSSSVLYRCYTTAQNNFQLFKMGSVGPVTKVATPTMYPVAGTYDVVQTVALSSTEGATIYYTTNGDEPTNQSDVYSTPILVSATDTTIKAYATKTGLTDSDKATATYVLQPKTPTITPNGGNYTSVQTVTLATQTADTEIRYTTNGDEPTAASTLYETPIEVSESLTIKAIATKANFTDSAVASAEFVITEPPTGFFEDFEQAPTTPNAYTQRTLTLSTGEWSVDAYTGNSASDRFEGAKSMRMRDANHNVTMNFDKTTGIGTVSFKLASYSTHKNGEVTLQYSTDQGATWVDVKAFTAPVWDTATGMIACSADVKVPGSARIRIIKTTAPSSSTVCVDSVHITDYDGEEVPVGDSTQTFTLPNGSSAMLAFTGVTATGKVTVQRTALKLDGTDTSAIFKNPENLAAEKLVINSTAVGGTATLTWTVAALPAGTNTLFRIEGDIKTEYPVTPDGNTVSVSGIDHFSEWYVGTSTAVPVTLSTFEIE